MENKTIPTLEEVINQCKIYGMLSKMNGSIYYWDRCDTKLFQQVLEYDREIVKRYYGHVCVWDLAFGIKTK